MKTTTIDIGAPSPRHICSNAGLLASARTATNLAVTDTIDDAFVGQQNPNLTHTVGSTMTSLALAHNLIVYTGLIDHAAGHGHEHQWWGWEPKTIRAQLISIAAVITRHARRLILRVDRAAPWQSLLRTVLGHQQHRAPS